MTHQELQYLLAAIAQVADGITVVGTDNIAQVNGATVNVGTGAAGTGTLRVAVSTDSSITANPTATVRAVTLTRATAASSVSAGAQSVSVYNAGTTDGVWIGAAIKPGEQFSYSVIGSADTLPAFAYTASATAILIISTVV